MLRIFMRVLVGQTEAWLEVAGKRTDVVEERLTFWRCTVCSSCEAVEQLVLSSSGDLEYRSVVVGASSGGRSKNVPRTIKAQFRERSSTTEPDNLGAA